MRRINFIVIHCSATRADKDFTVDDIRTWHKANGWTDVGYHYVIRLDGAVEPGRPEDKVGAHVAGFNAGSIGICYVGGYDLQGRPADTRTPAQVEAMTRLVVDLLTRYPGAEVLGHRDFPDVNKACPCFDAHAWWSEQCRAS